jgi:hypothetical protein
MNALNVKWNSELSATEMRQYLLPIIHKIELRVPYVFFCRTPDGCHLKQPVPMFACSLTWSGSVGQRTCFGAN